MGRRKVSKTDEDVRQYNNAKSKNHYDKNRSEINKARREKYAQQKASQVKPKRVRKEYTKEEIRVLKSKANRKYHEKNKSAIMAKRRAKGPRPRKEPENGWSKPHSFPIWQQHIDFHRARLRKALLGSTVKHFCEALTESCLSQSSLRAVDMPYSVLDGLRSKAAQLMTDLLNNLGTGAHTAQVEILERDIRSMMTFLDDIRCEGMVSMENLNQAYIERRFGFQHISYDLVL
ncbi:hypothetical protein NMY22_g9662 [Coprinellus aureogranulatus]|nr:hypothetical protein NMY22_g9662 [Coprinellus aureogranulatus]